LTDLPNEIVFNVPRGKMEILPVHKLRLFLTVQSNKTFFENLEQLGFKQYPYFVIDPFDRSNFPSIETGFINGSKSLH
jgi:hypothetical protein